MRIGIAAIMALAAIGLAGCGSDLMAGKHHVMSYGVEVGTDSSLRADAFTFSVSISGR